MKRIQRRSFGLIAILIILVGFAYYGCRTQTATKGTGAAGGQLEQLALSREFSPEEASAALETFIPPGKFDEFVMFTSGGHSGSVYLHGIPSMRVLKEIPVFAPNSWQGWAQGTTESMKLLREGSFFPNNPQLPVQTWGDLHHPQLSLTNGDYDGQWCFVSDKPTGRIAVIDLRDFKTKQIVKTPNIVSDHAVFIVGNTEYVVNSTFQPSPGGPGQYAPLDKYKELFRGAVTFHKFDRKAGRIKLEESFQMELPPYWQDLAIGGKGASDGWIFLNSMNTEMAIGAEIDGGSPLEIGASKNEMDYLHVIPWRKIEAFVKSGDPKVITRNGIKVVTLDTAREQGFLYMVPESKSPHGCDVSPGGEYILTSGKLDPHVTAYSFDKIQKAIANKTYEKMDEFGFPVLKYDAVREGYIEVGLGPLHTVFDDKGYGYTSLFLDSAVAKFSLGPPYHKQEEAWKLVDKINIHYNIGHLQAPGSNTTRPRGRYVVALNKWTVDRHPSLGPLNPQNAQLIDISGPKMRLLSESPLIGEPHNSMIIETDKLGAWRTYPEGTDPATMQVSPEATKQGQERVERNGNTVHAHMVVIRSHYKPDIIRVKQGDKVIIDITNVESAVDATHGFGLHGYNITASIDPGSTERVEFVANQSGVFPFYCTEFCSALHMEMAGWLMVEPK